MTRQQKSDKSIILFTYLAAISVAGLGLLLIPEGLLLTRTLFADILATFVVYGSSILYKNASIYDPYWSVAPPIIFLFWYFSLNDPVVFTVWDIIIFSVVLWWSVRLTINWAKRWKGITDEDWRYRNIRQQHPGIFWLINLAGIQMFPTVLVFAACIPLYYGLRANPSSLSVYDIAGFIICILAILIEYQADRELRHFLRKRQKPDQFLSEGLWSVSRHPNYLGEIIFWWGIFIAGIPGKGPAITVAGPLLITILFVFISIPMMKKHMLERYPGYRHYISETPVLPVPGKVFGKR